MASPAIWAMKDGDTQPTNFASTQSGLQAALDYAGLLGEVYVGPGTLTGVTNLTMYGKCTLRGSGPLSTLLVRSASATGDCLVEKTAAQGNTSGATGIVVRDLSIYGNGSSGGGINFGNAGGAAFNANAYLSDILVRDFASGVGVKLLANAIHSRDIWCIANQDGFELSAGGGANQIVGLWSEGNTRYHVNVACPYNVFHYTQIEQTGTAPSGALIYLSDTTSDKNLFSGVYMYLEANMANLIQEASGATNNCYINVVVVDNGHTYTNTIYNDVWAAGSGSVPYMPFAFDMSNGYTGFFRDHSNGTWVPITGAGAWFQQMAQGSDIASGANLNPSNYGNLFTVTGTADITSITAATRWKGRIITLNFSGTAATTGLTDGSNLKLAGNLAYTPDDTITLICDGTNWIEMCRSAN